MLQEVAKTQTTQLQQLKQSIPFRIGSLQLDQSRSHCNNKKLLVPASGAKLSIEQLPKEKLQHLMDSSPLMLRNPEDPIVTEIHIKKLTTKQLKKIYSAGSESPSQPPAGDAILPLITHTNDATEEAKTSKAPKDSIHSSFNNLPIQMKDEKAITRFIDEKSIHVKKKQLLARIEPAKPVKDISPSIKLDPLYVKQSPGKPENSGRSNHINIVSVTNLHVNEPEVQKNSPTNDKTPSALGSYEREASKVINPTLETRYWSLQPTARIGDKMDQGTGIDSSMKTPHRHPVQGAAKGRPAGRSGAWMVSNHRMSQAVSN